MNRIFLMREVTSYGLDDRVALLAGAGNVLFIVVSRPAVGPATGEILPGIMPPGSWD